MKRIELHTMRGPVTLGMAGVLLAIGVVPLGSESAFAQPTRPIGAEAVTVGDTSIDLVKKDGTEPDFTYNKVDYYNDAAKFLTLSVKNTKDEPVGQVEVKLNGETISNEAVTETSKEYSIDLGAPTIKDTNKGIVEVLIGGRKVYNRTFIIDDVDPEAKAAEIKGKVNAGDPANTYVETGSTIRLTSASDPNPGSGVKDAWLEFKDDKEGSKWEAVKGDDDANAVGANFNLDKTGSYRFAVRDNVGNVSYTGISALISGYADHITVQGEPDAPGTSIKVNGKDLTEDTYKDKAEAVVTVDTTSFFQTNIIKVNGETITTDTPIVNEVGKSRTYTLDLGSLPRAEDGRYTVEATSQSIFGGMTTQKWTVLADFDAPTLSDGEILGEYTIVDGKVYATGTGVQVRFRAADIGTGIQEVTVSNDAQVTDEGNGTYSFTATSGEAYAVTVTDKVGHTTTAPLTELGIGSNDIVIDDDNPVIERADDITAAYVDSEGREWLREGQDVLWKVTDANLADVTVTVNGEAVDVSPTADGIYRVKMDSVSPGPNGSYTLNINATDKAGNASTDAAQYYVDGDAPVDVKGTIDGEYTNTAFGIYSKSPLTLTLTSNDGQGSGTKGYRLLDANGGVVQDFASSITIPDGSYKVQAIDNLGNLSDPVSLQELMGLQSNVFVVDNIAPTISVQREDSSYQNWYNHQVSYNVGLADNTTVMTGTVRVNGTVVRSFQAESVTRETNLNFSTEGLTPNADGSYTVEVNVTDAAGNSSQWSETIRIDQTAPDVTGFVFTQPGFKEGQSISVDDNYGFFFQGATSVDVTVEDTGASSGIANVSYTLRNANGSVASSGQVNASGGRATIAIPDGFKGYIDAKVADNVKNESGTRHPSGVITEDRNWHVNTSSIAINVPDPGHRDASGQELYNSDTTASVPLTDTVSGFREVRWGIGGDTLGTATIGIDGSVSGTGFSTTSRDRNLVTGLNGNLPINGNTNGMEIWVRTTDRAGNTSESKKIVSIDKDAPTIDVAYNRTEASGFYNTNRVATVTITERNFDPAAVRMSGTYGSISSWRNVGGDRWQADVMFDGETEYQWGIGFTDMAGNEANPYNSEQFTVDKTAPVMSLNFNNNDVAHELFYKSARTAIVSVTDRNFDPSLVQYSGSGSLGGWSRNGDTWTSEATFGADGEYDFNVAVSDKATNAGNTVNSGKFIVDQTAPTLKVEGIEEGVSYKKDVNLSVSANDTYLDGAATSASLKGRARGPIELKGGVEGQNATFNLTDLPTDAENDDLYTLTSVATDLAGNEVKQGRVFSVNRNGSTFKFDDESLNGKYFQHLDHDIILTQTSVDRMDMSKFNVVVIKDGKQIEVPKDVWTVEESGGTDGPWVYTITVKKEFFKDDGRYQVQLFTQAVDGTEESSMAQEYAFVIDHTKPVVLVTGIADNETYTGGDRRVSVEVRDLSGPRDVKMYLNGDSIDYTESEGTYTVTLPANFRSQDFKVEVTDKAGNENVSEVNNFRLAGSWLEGMIGNPVVQMALGLLGALLVLLLGLLAWAVAKRRRDDKSRAEYQGIVGESSIEGDSSGSDGSGEWAYGAGAAGAAAAGYGAGNIGEGYNGYNEGDYQDVDSDTHSSDANGEDATGVADVDGEATGVADDGEATGVDDADDEETDAWSSGDADGK